ncbi:MAG: hypothetical protein ACP5E3_19415 [Bacteroidales bacterium]
MHYIRVSYLTAGTIYLLKELGVNCDPEYPLDVNGISRFQNSVIIENDIPKLYLKGSHVSGEITYNDYMVFEMFQREARFTPWNNGTAIWAARLGYWYEEEYWKTFSTYISSDGLKSNRFETSDSGLRFYSSTAGGVANVLYQTPGRFNIFRNYVDEYTILCVRAKPADPTDVVNNPREATLALIRTDDNGNEEFLDLYNNGYSDSHTFGLRLQKRGNGSFLNFVFEYSDGTFVQPAMTIAPGATTSESNATSVFIHNWFECGGPIVTYERFSVWAGAKYNNGIIKNIDIDVGATTHRLTVIGGIITAHEEIAS